MSEKKSLIQEYYEYQKFYEDKYGKNTIVLIEIGSFYEAYEGPYLDPVTNKVIEIGKAKIISDELNILLTKKNKTLEVSEKNPFMAGIPSVSMDKYVNILMSKNKYTIVKVDQTTLPPNVKREVTEILSPGSNTKVIGSNSFLMNIFFENLNQGNIGMGISIIDVSTGESFIFQSISTKVNKNQPFEDLSRMITKYYPKELVLTFNDFTKDEENFLIKKNYLGEYNKNIVEYKNDDYRIRYINKVFDELYSNNTMISGIEYLDLDMYQCAYNALQGQILFLKEHNPLLLNKIAKPKYLNETDKMILTNNSIYQLDIINSKAAFLDKGSLFSFLNATKTAMGSRLLKTRLLTPSTDIDFLRSEYKKIDKFTKDDLYLQLRYDMTGISDIERLIRRIAIGNCAPSDLYLIYDSVNTIGEILKKDEVSKILDTKETLKNIEEFRNYLNLKLDVNELKKYTQNDIDSNIYHQGVNSKIDVLLEKKKDLLNRLRVEQNKFDEEYNIESRIDSTDKEGYFLTASASRMKTKNVDKEVYVLKKYTSKVKIYSDAINMISEELLSNNSLIIRLNKELFVEELNYIYDVYSVYFDNIIRSISELDVITNNAYVAKKFNYKKPEIKKEKSAFVKCNKLRHPLVEHITESEYVSNDILLDNDNLGKTIFGVNATGKSTILKATGIAVIMAQSGMFVAGEMVYSPFKSIFTRISGDDNLFKNQSTFTVEMLELKMILNSSDENTLVLGDELTHGTETLSAISIFSTTIMHLIKKKAKFLLTTHLHQLTELDHIVREKKLSLEHLSVELNEKTEELIYERKLKKGSGSSIYGLLVAKGLGLDEGFIEEAKKTLKLITKNKTKFDTILENKKNKYNKSKINTKCEICGQPASDTHHIEEQNTRDDNGFTRNGKINRETNIVNVCKNCHNIIHKSIRTFPKELESKSMEYIQTSGGVKLWIHPLLVNEMGIDIDSKSDLISY